MRTVNDNDLLTTIKRIACIHAERRLSIVRVLRIDEQQDAGFPAPFDPDCCKTCGAAVEDYSVRYCITCMPVCQLCDKPTNSPNQNGECDLCVEAAWARRSSRTWNGNNMGPGGAP